MWNTQIFQVLVLSIKRGAQNYKKGRGEAVFKVSLALRAVYIKHFFYCYDSLCCRFPRYLCVIRKRNSLQYAQYPPAVASQFTLSGYSSEFRSGTVVLLGISIFIFSHFNLKRWQNSPPKEIDLMVL